ncbi:hypothetical protein SELMODRAFT_80420 [Selaginella moellendorffii]|uniref:DNA replication complex GINS protein PSF2 n=1 Tax=Selaginella moellendorffii TaxID=88036 RepID=D8QY03_SELML|nr:hypothetical protein SELMODRAFT_80420 [Selaginella moellendorffii]
MRLRPHSPRRRSVAIFPAPSRFNLAALQVEFLAEDETIGIIPSLRMDPLHLISGDFGPFRPQISAIVPLWLAIALKKRGKCRIQAPEWMTVERLTEVLEEERQQPQEFRPLPFHYIEISRLLFDHAQDDIPDCYLVRSLIEDIRNVRFHKIEAGLEKLSNKTFAVKLTNLSAMEVNIIRPFTVRTLQALFKHGSDEYHRHSDDRFSQPTVIRVS